MALRERSLQIPKLLQFSVGTHFNLRRREGLKWSSLLFFLLPGSLMSVVYRGRVDFDSLNERDRTRIRQFFINLSNEEAARWYEIPCSIQVGDKTVTIYSGIFSNNGST